MIDSRRDAPNRHYRPSGVRLSAAHQIWLYAIGGLLLASGAAWLVFHYLVTVRNEFGSARHPLESWLLKIHGGAAMAMLVVFGTLLTIHIRRAWQLRRNRGSGIAMFASVAWLTATGWGLYYFGDESLRAATSVAHWAVGIAIAAVFALHVVLGQRLRKASAPQERRLALQKHAAHELTGPSHARYGHLTK